MRAKPTSPQPANRTGFAIVLFLLHASHVNTAYYLVQLYLLPELHLRRQLFWLHLFCRSSHYRICPFPLCTRYKNCSHRSFWRHVQLQPSQMCLLSRKCDTRSGIDGELYHIVPVIKQKLPELRRPFSLSLSQHRQIEADHQPSHFKLLRIHGLYLPDFPEINASR